MNLIQFMENMLFISNSKYLLFFMKYYYGWTVPPMQLNIQMGISKLSDLCGVVMLYILTGSLEI